MADISAFGAQQEGDLFKKTVILVEDDPSNAEVLKILLGLENLCQTTCFRSGGETLANVDLIKSLRPVLFLLDYGLPFMTGLDLYEQLHTTEGLEQVPAIILSGSQISSEEQDRIKQRGLIFIQKPYDIDYLLTTIEQVVV